MGFETIGFDEDNIHFILQSVPKYFAWLIFWLVKSITAMHLFKKYPDLRKELWGRVLEWWGHVATVGEGVNAEIMRIYIKNQGRKAEQLKL